jgi:plastocyanin
MKRRAFLALAGTGVSATLAGCFDGQAAEDNRITMTQAAFRPDELTVPVGTTVEFDNTSSHSHTVTASGIPGEAEYFASGGFDNYDEAKAAWDKSAGGKLEPGDSYEHTFETPGRHDYVCIPHLRADMVGVIHVEAEDEVEDENSTSA